MPSTKRSVKKSSGTAEPGDRRRRVSFHRDVARVVAAHGGAEGDFFRPQIRALVELLEADPKRYPKKSGRLKRCRSAAITVDNGVVWRAVFVVKEREREVRIIALGPHDRAYKDAGRRLS